MVRLNQLSGWSGQDDEVIPIVITRKDTDIPEDHWDEFAEYATYSDTSTWDAALEQMEEVYKEWLDETFCEECNERYEYDCECNNEEEEEDDE